MYNTKNRKEEKKNNRTNKSGKYFGGKRKLQETGNIEREKKENLREEFLRRTK